MTPGGESESKRKQTEDYRLHQDHQRTRMITFTTEFSILIHDRPIMNIAILKGDLNATIGSDNRIYEEIMGKQRQGKMNDIGERFADFYATSKPVIRGVFQHTGADISSDNHVHVAR